MMRRLLFWSLNVAAIEFNSSIVSDGFCISCSILVFIAPWMRYILPLNAWFVCSDQLWSLSNTQWKIKTLFIMPSTTNFLRTLGDNWARQISPIADNRVWWIVWPCFRFYWQWTRANVHWNCHRRWQMRRSIWIVSALNGSCQTVNHAWKYDKRAVRSHNADMYRTYCCWSTYSYARGATNMPWAMKFPLLLDGRLQPAW